MPSDLRNSNDTGKQERLEFIQAILKGEVGLTPRDIRPIAYEDNFPFPYNNFVYAVTFNLGALYGGQQPGTLPIPIDVDKCIIRLPNATSGYNNRIRVENEVAALALAREGLQSSFPGLVPRVYAWGSAKSRQGWILQELMPGSPLLDDFNAMDHTNKTVILRQMAGVLAALQRCELPATVHDFGGLQFAPSGHLISAPLSIMDAGPFTRYEDLVRATIESKLVKADTDPQIKGWQANGIRSRLNKFMKEGFPRIMAKMGSWPKILVHADFAPDNFLYDKRTMRLTALLDFDFTHIATYCDEFYRSLSDRIGRFPSTRESDELSALRKSMLTGFPHQLPKANDEVDWPSAKAWDDALSEYRAAKPSTIKDIDPLSDLFWLSGQLLPFKLCNPTVVRNSTIEALERWKAQGEASLNDFLTNYGY